MTAAFRRPLLVWLTLLALSAVSFATRLPTPRATAAAILTLALLKSLLLLWHFMDLRHAHVLWKLAMTLLITGLPALIFVLMN